MRKPDEAQFVDCRDIPTETGVLGVNDGNISTVSEYDVIVVGGGVTGAAIARDAALRGMRALLLERDDFGSGTSSRSSKMIHGGLRYLETYQFGLVAEGVREREVSLKLAPHITHITPHMYLIYEGDSYGLGMLNMAMTFYDVASGQWRKRRHTMLSAKQVLEREPHLNPKGLKGAGLYYDALTDDARYTIDMVNSAYTHGADVANHAHVTGLIKDSGWVVGVEVENTLTGSKKQFYGRVVVNATGPWTNTLLAEEYGTAAAKLKPSKGAHIVFDKADFPLNTVIFLRSPDDGRVTWPTPSLEHDRVYVGTTDTAYTGDPDHVEPDEKDIEYLLNVANHTIPEAKLTESHIIGSWAGLRPLVAPAPGVDVGSASREHKVETGPGGMVTISGGKLTSNRVMAKHVVDEVASAIGFPRVPYLAKRMHLWGGTPLLVDIARRALAESDVPAGLADAWLAHHGANALAVLELWREGGDNTTVIGPRGLTVAEIRYYEAQTFCCTLEDLMIRRTSLFFWDPDGGLGTIEAICDVLDPLFGWTPKERSAQIRDYAEKVRRHRPASWRSPYTLVEEALEP